MYPLLKQAVDRMANPARRRAFAASEEGRFGDAVTLAEEAVAERPDAVLERRLVEWRHRAFVRGEGGRADWPPAAGDPFPDAVDVIPEVAGRALDSATLAGALQHHGSLLVRGLLGEAAVQAMRREIDASFDARLRNPQGEARGARYVPTTAITDPELKIAREWQSGGALLMADAPRALALWPKVLAGCGALEVITGYLGERPALSAKKTTLYRIPGQAGAQWHQDGAFLGEDTRTVNVWVALSPCGVDAPGLDVVPWRIPQVLPTGTHGSFFVWSVGEGLVDEVIGDRKAASPVFQPGDALLFDHLCLHRTGVRPEMTKERYAVESWLFAPSRYPDDSPLVI